MLGFFPAFPKRRLGVWPKTSQMTEWRQMPHTDGNAFHWDKQTTAELCQPAAALFTTGANP